LKYNKNIFKISDVSYCYWLIEFAKDRSFFYGSDMVGRFLGYSPTCVRRYATVGQILILDRSFVSSYPSLSSTFYLQDSVGWIVTAQCRAATMNPAWKSLQRTKQKKNPARRKSSGNLSRTILFFCACVWFNATDVMFLLALRYLWVFFNMSRP